ncbi:hypothetical protein D5366_03435 [Neokomagataea tanensis]|uniref:Uncharacterized protein n=3 Tax=Neokomagataea TaxID=1223423 RepID=A0A4Y6V7H4_9PROT|nr:hypothetical protein D5366_03435 [Neokomagataea tanensis]
MDLQVRDKNNNSDWTSIFQGRVDYIKRSHKTRCIAFECRDGLAKLIDTRFQAEWMNYNGSDIFKKIAEKTGLEIEYNAPVLVNDRMFGQFWQVEHKRNMFIAQSRFQTAADVVFNIAREMSCDVYAEGSKIFCSPVYSNPQPTSQVYDLDSIGFEGFFSTDVGLSQGIVVHYASWDSRQRISTHVFYDGSDFLNKAPDGQNLIYSFKVAGKKLEDLKNLARTKFNRLNSHIFSSEISLPGILDLKPRNFFSISINNSKVYLSVERVISEFSLSQGFIQKITVKKRYGYE